MDFLELAKNRYSVRSFKKEQITKQELDKILEAGRVAPTACNFQPQRILVLQSKENLEKLKECTPFHFEAPTVLLICVDKTEAWKRKQDGKEHGDIDASIITTHMMLEAYNIGIGSTWVCSFNPEKIKEKFDLPEEYEPVNVLPIGYPAEDAKPNIGHEKRLELSQTVFYEKF